MNRRDADVLEILIRHERWVAADRQDLPAQDGFVDATDRARHDGYTIDSVAHVSGMPRREARRALARLVAAGTVTVGGRFVDQYRIADRNVGLFTVAEPSLDV